MITLDFCSPSRRAKGSILSICDFWCTAEGGLKDKQEWGFIVSEALRYGVFNLGRCLNHPDTETSYACMKHNIYMCEKCLACRDPEIYCKFRTSCAIHFLTKRKGDLDNQKEFSEAPS